MSPSGDSSCSRCGTHLGPGIQFCPRCGTSVPLPPASAPATVATAPDGPREAEAQALLDALRQATLGEYEILAELGRGGMATVYLAHDLALDRKVAIKVLAPALLLMGEGMVERFKREARTAAALSHPHIIPIYAVKERDRVLYFVMKYVSGRALDSIIRDTGSLPVPMVQAILAHVADALSYAHRHGVIHRDIKSANIMLDEDGWAVVTDFGIAKVVQAQGLTLTGVTVGTPTYMSPEQCATEEVTGASDQYSLGVVAYEMLTGKLPFHGESIMAVMYAHFNERPVPVTERRPDCPPNLAASIMRMLEKDPARRWPSMDDVVATCGRPSLRHDDPVRSQMITLAKAGGRSQWLARLQTPTSPIALTKPQKPRPAPAPRARRTRVAWWGLGLAASAAALWWAAPWRVAPSLPPARSVAGSDTVPPVTTARLPTDTASAPRTEPAKGPSRRAREPGRAARVTAPPAANPESVSRVAATLRDDSSVRSLRATAAAARQRALDAGATPPELAKGDATLRGADSLATQGRVSEAMIGLATAASLWSEAERGARTRAARDSARQRPAEPPAAPPAVRPPPDQQAEIKAVIADYARALESRDLSEVRRVYPGLTAAEAETFRQFFDTFRGLKAQLSINQLVIAGNTANALVSAVYDYVATQTGRTRRDATTFRATFVQDSTGWHLAAIRAVR